MGTDYKRGRRSSSRGFTLVEIMIVVVIIGLLAALGVPAYARVRRASQNSRTVNDFRVFSQAFEIYNTQNGFWPSNVGPGIVPTLPVPMSGDFRTQTWQSVTAIGGQWNWDNGNFGFTASVSISNFTCDDSQLAEIDAKLDDGNLTSGIFQKVSANRVMYILEQ